MPEFITIEHGDLVCLCGNDAPNEGFGMSDAAGNVIDPDDALGNWDGIYYRCGRCGRVIDQRTGAVVTGVRLSSGAGHQQNPAG